MSEEEIREMLEQLVEEIDYDIYKEMSFECYEPLIKIVKKHVVNWAIPSQHHPDCNCRECK